jgi:hypothetical protein
MDVCHRCTHVMVFRHTLCPQFAGAHCNHHNNMSDQNHRCCNRIGKFNKTL